MSDSSRRVDNEIANQLSLEGAVQDALKAAEPAAKEVMRALESLPQPQNKHDKDALEGARLAAEAAYSAVKAARAANQVSQRQTASWRAAFASLLRKAHHYWRKPKAWKGPAAKRQYEETNAPSVASSPGWPSYRSDEEPYVAWTHGGTLKIRDNDEAYFTPKWTSPDWPVGNLHVFELVEGELESDAHYFRFPPPSSDVLFRVGDRTNFGDEYWIIVPTRPPLDDWGERWPKS